MQASSRQERKQVVESWRSGTWCTQDNFPPKETSRTASRAHTDFELSLECGLVPKEQTQRSKAGLINDSPDQVGEAGPRTWCLLLMPSTNESTLKSRV